MKISLTKLLKLTSIFSFLFTIFYSLFFIFYNPIHNFYPEIDKKTIVWFFQNSTFKDGIELEVMFLGTGVYLLLAYFISLQLYKIKILNNKLVQLCLIVPAIIILSKINPDYIRFTSDFKTNLLLFSGIFTAVLIIFWFYHNFFKKKILKIAIFYLSWILLTALILLNQSVISIHDYDFFLAPALKISQGETFRSFYMQYGLFMTLLFKYLLDLKFDLFQIRFVLEILYLLWFIVFYKLASKLIKNRFLIFFLIVSVVIIRFFGIKSEALTIPASLPMRLDLWVFLVFIAYRFSLTSFITGFSFLITYLFIDDLFGFFYLGLYSISLIFIIFKRSNFSLSKFIILNKKIFGIIFLLLSGLMAHFLIFGSFAAPAAKHYHNVQLGLEPISLYSFFWIIFALLPYAVFLFSKEENLNRKIIYFFLVGTTLCQLIYFFGRSVELNLMSTSTIFLIVAFICLDQLIKVYKLKNLTFLTAALFITVSIVMFNTKITEKLSRNLSYLLNQEQVKQTYADYAQAHRYVVQFIDQNPNLLIDYQDKNKLIFLSIYYDSYINYRYQIPQQGFFVPFGIHIYLDEVGDFISSKLSQGYKLVFFEDEMALLIEQINEYNLSHIKNFILNYDKKGKLFEISQVKSTQISKEKPRQSKKVFKINDWASFQYPFYWTADKLKKGDIEIIDLKDSNNRFHISFQPLTLPAKTTLEEFSQKIDQSLILYKDNNQIDLKFPSAEAIYAKTWTIDNTYGLEVIVFKDSKAIDINTWPINFDISDGYLKYRLSPIISSLDIK